MGDLDLFSHLVDYQQTDEFTNELAERTEKLAVIARPKNRQYSDKYRKNHPDYIKARTQAQKYKSTLYTLQNGLCHWCNKQLMDNAEIDHIIPLTKNGTNDIANLCLACQTCNRKRQNKL